MPIPPPFISFPIAAVEPPPRPPRSPRRPSSPKIEPRPLPVVEDDNQSKGGVKPSKPSAFTLPKPAEEPPRIVTPTTPYNLASPAPALNETPPQTPPSRPPRSPLRQYQSIFLANAFERPRDPDEIGPHPDPRIDETEPRQRTSHHHRSPYIPTPHAPSSRTIAIDKPATHDVHDETVTPQMKTSVPGLDG
ncbi:hypothetical protein EDB86DRAFT_2831477 [Lactarius hatsudake]|nr:hypothetical protein EDB86DRAFT_2831477 [Lactarius hatsudake]